MRGNRRISSFFRALALIVATIAQAQETTNCASLGGRVTDPSGAVVSNLQVTAREVSTNIGNSATDHEGRFRFAYLKVGRYELEIVREGFEPLKRSLTLTVGSAFEVPLQLAIGTATSSVIVSSEGPVLETARTQVASTISQAEIKELPLKGQNRCGPGRLVAAPRFRRLGRRSGRFPALPYPPPRCEQCKPFSLRNVKK